MTMVSQLTSVYIVMQLARCLALSDYTHWDNFTSSHCGSATSLLQWRSSSCTSTTPISWGSTVSWFCDALNTFSFSKLTKILQ